MAAVTYGLILSVFFPQFSFDGLPAIAYFTVQSNILVLLFLLYALICSHSTGIHIILRGTVLVSILVTGLVFHIILVPYYPELFAEGVSFRHHLTHTIAPLGFILDWLLFDQKRLMQFKHLKYWLIYPFAYWLVTMVRGSFSAVYPYFFMDLNLLGFSFVALWFIIMTIIFTLLGLLIILIDNKR